MENLISQKVNARHSFFEKDVCPDVLKNDINLNIAVTNKCNCDCIFCFSHMKPQANKEIDPDLMLRLLDEGKKMGITEFNPYGNYGDPFCCEKIYDYVAYAKKIGFKYIFTNTNGIALDSENSKRAIEAGFDSIRFSINAGTAENYGKIHGVEPKAFYKVLDNLIRLDKLRKDMKSKMILSVSFVSIDKNEKEIAALKKTVEPYIDDFLVFPLMNPRYAFEDLEILQNNNALLGCAKKNEKGCNRIFNSIYINQEGFMTVCALDEGGFGIIDDMRGKSLEEVWLGARFQEIRSKHISGNLEGTVCGNCLNCEHHTIHSFFSEFNQYSGHQRYFCKPRAKKRNLV